MNKFESLQIGEKAELKHLITQDDINRFVELTGDDNKLHVNAEYAKTTSFKKPVAHGMMVLLKGKLRFFWKTKVGTKK